MPITFDYCFTEQDAERAFAEWNCNCGPTALAFAARLNLNQVRPAIPEFEAKGYTSPTMMKQALAHLRIGFQNIAIPSAEMLAGFVTSTLSLAGDTLSNEALSIVRVQWTGPWTQPGMNPRWAYNFTHWIAAWKHVVPMIFDCNGGIRSLSSWNKEIVPILTGEIKRADGGWFPTHVWRLRA